MRISSHLIASTLALPGSAEERGSWGSGIGCFLLGRGGVLIVTESMTSRVSPLRALALLARVLALLTADALVISRVFGGMGVGLLSLANSTMNEEGLSVGTDLPRLCFTLV